MIVNVFDPQEVVPFRMFSWKTDIHNGSARKNVFSQREMNPQRMQKDNV